MGSKPESKREGRAERRRFPRASTPPRYARMRAEAEPPPAFGRAGRALLRWLERTRMSARLWRYRHRKVVS
jgi:hypothetical protein